MSEQLTRLGMEELGEYIKALMWREGFCHHSAYNNEDYKLYLQDAYMLGRDKIVAHVYLTP